MLLEETCKGIREYCLKSSSRVDRVWYLEAELFAQSGQVGEGGETGLGGDEPAQRQKLLLDVAPVGGAALIGVGVVGQRQQRSVDRLVLVFGEEEALLGAGELQSAVVDAVVEAQHGRRGAHRRRRLHQPSQVHRLHLEEKRNPEYRNGLNVVRVSILNRYQSKNPFPFLFAHWWFYVEIVHWEQFLLKKKKRNTNRMSGLVAKDIVTNQGDEERGSLKERERPLRRASARGASCGGRGR